MSGPATQLSDYVTKTSVTLAVLSFIAGIVFDYVKKRSAGLEVHLARVGAAGALPTGIILVYGAFEPSVITQLSGLNVPIAAAGLALIYISVKTIFK